MLTYYSVDLKKQFDRANELTHKQLSDLPLALNKLEQNVRDEINNSKEQIVLVSEDYHLTYIRTLENWRLIEATNLPKCKEFDRTFSFTSNNYNDEKSKVLIVIGTYKLINYKDCRGVTYWDEVRYHGRIKSIASNIEIIKPDLTYRKRFILDEDA